MREHRIEFLAKQQHSLDCSLASSLCTKDCCKRNLDWFLRESQGRTKLGDYVFLKLSNDITKTHMLRRAVNVYHRALRQGKHALIIQCQDLVERITTDRITIASLPNGVPPIPLVSASEVEIQYNRLKETTWLFHNLPDHFLNDDSPLESFLN